jgi:hypothetical protein
VKLMRLAPAVALLAALVVAAPAGAQTRSTIRPRPVQPDSDVTSRDIQQLQDTIYQVSRDVAQMRSRDATLASQLQAELDDASDEAIYLKVKLRKNEPLARSEYADVRDRVENIRSRARGDAAGGYTTPGRPGDDPYRAPVGRITGNQVPVGTEFDVRLQSPLSSKTAQVEDRIEATTLVDLTDDRGRVVVPAGSVMRGIVSGVNKAGRVERKGSLTVAFDQITINGRSHSIRATVTDALESEGIKGEVGKIGVGAGAGAILGAILGGAKGALAGILIGGGGTIAATEGNDVELPAGQVLRVRLDSALELGR